MLMLNNMLLTGPGIISPTLLEIEFHNRTPNGGDNAA